jgi:hypothetical protein
MRPVQGGIERSGFGDGGGHDDDDGETANRSVVIGPYGLVRRRQREKKTRELCRGKAKSMWKNWRSQENDNDERKMGYFYLDNTQEMTIERPMMGME